MCGSMVSSELAYYKDATQQVMRWLLPADQWSMSMSTGCRPISPMVIAIIGVASQPIVYLAHTSIRCPQKYAPRERTYMDWVEVSAHLFTMPHVYKIVAWLYREVLHLYPFNHSDAPPNSLARKHISLLMRDPDQPQSTKKYLRALLFEDSEVAGVLGRAGIITCMYSGDFYQRALCVFTRSPTQNNMYNLQHINQRNVNADKSMNRALCHLDFSFTNSWNFVVRCSCMGHVVNFHADIYINTNSPGRLYVSRETLRVAARIYHLDRLGFCAFRYIVDIVPQ